MRPIYSANRPCLPARVKALGITHVESLPAHADLATEAKDASARLVRNLSTAHASATGTVTLTIYLRTPDEEQIVTDTLLESAAYSVQQHDIDPPA